MKFTHRDQTEERAKKLIMDLYCSGNECIDANGVERMTPLFKCVSMANFLSYFTKFGGIDTKRNEEGRRTKHSLESNVASDEEDGGKSLSGLQQEIKAAKREEERLQYNDKFVGNMESISKGL